MLAPFDKDLIFAYCQPVHSLFCGPVYCVAGQVGTVPPESRYWQYTNKDRLQAEAESYIEELDHKGDINVCTKIVTVDRFNIAQFNTDRVIKGALRHMIWQYAYENKITNPKVHLCGLDYRFGLDGELTFIEGIYPESNVIRAISYLKRYSELDTYYKGLYPHYELEDNLGMLTLRGLYTLMRVEYSESFCIRPSIILGLPRLIRGALRYLPSYKGEGLDYELDLIGETMLDPNFYKGPKWWSSIQYVDYPDKLADPEFKEELWHILGYHSDEFREWLTIMAEDLESVSAIPLTFKEVLR